MIDIRREELCVCAVNSKYILLRCVVVPPARDVLIECGRLCVAAQRRRYLHSLFALLAYSFLV